MSFYCFTRKICLFFLRLYFKFEVKGIENVEKHPNGVVLISNHVSYLDPIILGIFLKRKLFFMAKKELFHIPVLGKIILKLGAFSVKRNANDLDAIKTAVVFAKQGEAVAMFPQGHRTKQIKSLKPKTGFLRIALQANVEIITCSLFYSSFLPRSRVILQFNPPINCNQLIKKAGLDLEKLKFKDIKELSLKVWDDVLKLNEYQENLYSKK